MSRPYIVLPPGHTELADVAGLDAVVLPWGLRPCVSGQCSYVVSAGSTYCCGSCGDAWEATPRYEPHAHSAGCKRRQAERAGGGR